MNLGLELALTGMSTVFSFLILLIFVTSIMSHLVKRFEEQPRSEPGKPNFQPSETGAKRADKTAMPAELLTTIVAAAIHKHRSRNRK